MPALDNAANMGKISCGIRRLVRAAHGNSARAGTSLPAWPQFILPEAKMFTAIIAFYDSLQRFWERAATERGFGMILLWVYLCTLGAVELQRMKLFPSWLPPVPDTHFFSIQLAFTLILVLEVISLIFILPSSLSRSMGKQLEILTLILLRNAFKELSLLPEPVSIGMENLSSVIDIAVSGAGAICVFLCLGFYRQNVVHQPFLKNKALIQGYIRSKKLLAFALLLIFAWLCGRDCWLALHNHTSNFFETIYTILIFADIAMVLIAQRYMPCYYAVFRNSGFVIGTLMMRLALSAPPLLCSALAVFAGLYVLALTWGTNRFMPKAVGGE